MTQYEVNPSNPVVTSCDPRFLSHFPSTATSKIINRLIRIKGQSGNAVESGNALFPLRYCRYENNMTEIKTSRDNTPITIRKDCAPAGRVAVQLNPIPDEQGQQPDAKKNGQRHRETREAQVGSFVETLE